MTTCLALQRKQNSHTLLLKIVNFNSFIEKQCGNYLLKSKIHVNINANHSRRNQ